MCNKAKDMMSVTLMSCSFCWMASSKSGVPATCNSSWWRNKKHMSGCYPPSPSIEHSCTSCEYSVKPSKILDPYLNFMAVGMLVGRVSKNGFQNELVFTNFSYNRNSSNSVSSSSPLISCRILPAKNIRKCYCQSSSQHLPMKSEFLAFVMSIMRWLGICTTISSPSLVSVISYKSHIA